LDKDRFKTVQFGLRASVPYYAKNAGRLREGGNLSVGRVNGFKEINMKKLLLVGMAALLLAAAVSAQTEADFEVELTADGAGVVIKKYVGKALQVRIPAAIQGMPVKEIGQEAFLATASKRGTWQRITSVVIPEGVTKIGNSAFNGWLFHAWTGYSEAIGSLTSVTIPASVTDIGDEAFRGQVALTSVTLPKGLSKAGESIFEDCTALKTVTIPEGVTVIGGNMFSGCTALAAITIPASVTSIGASAFYKTGLTSITWPAGIAAIPGNIGESPPGIFENCTKLTRVVLPEGVTTIGRNAFKGCTALVSIALPSTIFEIQNGAFNGCTALTTVTFPGAVKAIYFSGERSYGGDKDGGLNTSQCPKLNLATQAALRRIGAGSRIVAIPAGVTEIGERAYRNRGLNAVIIPPSVTAIGKGAFYGNSGLNTITIGANVNITHDWNALAFEKFFIEAYSDNGKKAGVYKYAGGAWTYTE
jgi:hypothetical protein